MSSVLVYKIVPLAAEPPPLVPYGQVIILTSVLLLFVCARVLK